MRSWMSSKFVEIRPWTAELPALEYLEKWLLSVVSTLVPTFLIQSSSFFHVTRTFLTGLSSFF